METEFSLHERLTRSLAYMLRHQPEEFDLELDKFGWGDLDDVVRALNERLGESVEEADVNEALAGADRARYEIKDGRIRALYGHSIEVDPGEPDEPPDELFATVRGRDVPNVERDGLKSVRRSHTHLSLTEEEGREVGRRLDRRYAVIRVLAGDAWEDGIDFYDRGAIFLSEEIPTEFIDEIDEYDDGVEREGFGGRSRGRRGQGRGRGRGRDRDDDRGRGRHREDRGRERDNDRDSDRDSDRNSDRNSARESDRDQERDERAEPKGRKPAAKRETDDGFALGVDDSSGDSPGEVSSDPTSESKDDSNHDSAEAPAEERAPKAQSAPEPAPEEETEASASPPASFGAGLE
jgi:putative RNA 2'-phosphotransferase